MAELARVILSLLFYAAGATFAVGSAIDGRMDMFLAGMLCLIYAEMLRSRAGR